MKRMIFAITTLFMFLIPCKPEGDVCSPVSRDGYVTEPILLKHEKYPMLTPTNWEDEQEAIRNEIFYGELEELVLLVHAEAGNQDITGKRLVADVVFNRIRSDKFPDTIHDVINQKNQFSTSKSLLKHAYNLTQSDFDAVMMAVDEPLNTKILYFDSLGGVNGNNHFKHGGHWFGE